MTAARLRFVSVLVVITRWSIDLDVIFIISSVRCTAMIEYYRSKLSGKKITNNFTKYCVGLF